MTLTSGVSFDPAGYFAFDLAHGAVHTRHGDRVLMLTSDVISPLVATAARHGDLTAVRSLGKRMGDHAAQSLGGDVSAQAPEDVLHCAAATLAMLGWGVLVMERWGSALVLGLEGAPTLDADSLGLAALLGGLLTSLGGRDVACVPIAKSARFVVVHPQVAETVWSWAKDGAGVPEVVSRLSEEEAA
jgi:hypothetical protein